MQGDSGHLIKIGYTFKDWNTQAEGTGIAYAEKATFQMGQANITLYVQWTVNQPTTGGDSNPSPTKVTITLQTNGGTPIEITYNTKVGNTPMPTREGYRFYGWYQDEVLTKSWPEDTVLRENISLYAKWIAFPVDETEQP